MPKYKYDLVAAEAKYHSDCNNSFLNLTSGGKICRPERDYITSAMEKIFAFIVNHDDFQFYEEPSIGNITSKSKLKLRYGNRIIRTEK